MFLRIENEQQRLLPDYHIITYTLAAWSTLDELRLVANTVKHANGHKCAELKSRRPDQFHPLGRVGGESVRRSRVGRGRPCAPRVAQRTRWAHPMDKRRPAMVCSREDIAS